MIALPGHQLVAHLAFGILDEDAPLRPLDEHDQGNHGNHHGDQKQQFRTAERALTAKFQGRANRPRQPRHDPGKNNQGNPVSYAARGNLLAQPHEEHRPADNRDHGGDAEKQPRIYYHRPVEPCMASNPTARP